MPAGARATLNGPIVVLGAGYAGLRVAQEVARHSRRRVRPILVDRHSVHTLRTELYEIDRLAEPDADPARWLVPLSQALDATSVEFRGGEVESIDLDVRSVTVGGSAIPFGGLAICLGSVPAYFGVPGAAALCHQVYGFQGAQRLASELRMRFAASAETTARRPLRVVVVGGGSTGTELAAEIASAHWERIVAPGAVAPEVTLVTGALPLLDGLPRPLVDHARTLLGRARVRLLEHRNVTRVSPEELELEKGDPVPFDVAVWCAGVQAPPVVRALDAPHGHSGRLRVEPTLELPGNPGVFGVGDAAEFQDPATGVIAPATAQAALAEAPTAGRNLVARIRGRPLVPFRYRQRGVIVSVGVGKASGRAAGVTIWGNPAAILKSFVEKGYSFAAKHRTTPRGL